MCSFNVDCGRAEGEEGYRLCIALNVRLRMQQANRFNCCWNQGVRITCIIVYLYQQQRSLSSEYWENVVATIERPDKMASLGSRNMLGVVTAVSEGFLFPKFVPNSEKWPTLKIIHGKPRHPESQGAVERANRDIKDALFTAIHDNSNDQCWG